MEEYIIPRGKTSPFNRLPIECKELICDMIAHPVHGDINAITQEGVYGFIDSSSLVRLCYSNHADLVRQYLVDFDVTYVGLVNAFKQSCIAGKPAAARVLSEFIDVYAIHNIYFRDVIDYDVLCLLAEHKVDIRYQARHLSIQNDDIELCKLAIKHSSNVNELFDSAIKNSSKKVIRHLLETHPDACVYNFSCACALEDIEGVIRLIPHEIDTILRELYFVAETGNTSILRILQNKITLLEQRESKYVSLSNTPISAGSSNILIGANVFSNDAVSKCIIPSITIGASALSGCHYGVCIGSLLESSSVAETQNIIIGHTRRSGDVINDVLTILCVHGYIEAVREFIDYINDTNANDINYEDGFCRASISGHIDVVALLLPKVDDANMALALHSACRYGHSDIVQLFVDAKRIPTTDLPSCISCACVYGHIPIMQLLDPDANITFNIPNDLKHHSMVKFLVETGRLPISSCTFDYACQFDDVELFARSSSYMTVRGCIMACKYNSINVIKCILLDCAKYEIYTNYSMYSELCKFRDIQIVRKLVDIAVASEYIRESAMFNACRAHNIPMIKRLVDAGIATVGDFSYGLAAACASGDFDIIHLMLHYGAADVNRGLVAAYNGHRARVEKMMISLGATYSETCSIRAKANEYGGPTN